MYFFWRVYVEVTWFSPVWIYGIPSAQIVTNKGLCINLRFVNKPQIAFQLLSRSCYTQLSSLHRSYSGICVLLLSIEFRTAVTSTNTTVIQRRSCVNITVSPAELKMSWCCDWKWVLEKLTCGNRHISILRYDNSRNIILDIASDSSKRHPSVSLYVRSFAL